MVLFTVRQRKIFELLWGVRDYITVKDIADEVSYSEKTVRSDLDVIRQEVCHHNIGKLVAKTNRGFFLDIDRAAYDKIAATFVEKKVDSRIKNRMCRLLTLLLIQPKTTLQELADCVYLDKGAVKKYVNEAELWLAQRGIELKKSAAYYGIECCETVRRKAFWFLFIELKRCLKTEGSARPMVSSHIAKQKYLDDLDYLALKTVFKNERHCYDAIVQCIEALEARFGINYTYDGYVWLIFSFMLTVHRLGQEEDISPGQIHPCYVNVQRCPEQEMAHYVCQQLASLSGITVSEGSRHYITVSLLTSELNEVKDKSVQDAIFASPENLQRVTHTFIASLSHVVSSELSRDKQLLFRLVLLIRPMLYRFAFDMNRAETDSTHSLARQVKLSYLDLFLEVELCRALYEQHYGITLSEHEIGLITLCIKNAQSMALKKVRVAIVCNYGIGISQFVAQKIKRAITQVDIVDIISVRELNRLDENFCDLVITTVPLNRDKETTIQVNDVLLPYDLSLIKETVKKMQKNKMLQTLMQQHQGKKTDFQDYILPHMMFVLNANMSKNEVLTFVCQQAVSAHYIKPEYLESVMARENASSTEIAAGVVLTHGDPALVKQNFISLILLDEPILWGEGQYCDVIFMVAFRKEPNGKIDGNVAGFYTRLASWVENEEAMKMLRQCSSGRALYEYLIHDIENEKIL